VVAEAVEGAVATEVAMEVLEGEVVSEGGMGSEVVAEEKKGIMVFGLNLMDPQVTYYITI
jgi:hypothetical protein